MMLHRDFRTARSLIVCGLLAMCVLPSLADAQDWSRFRGPNGTGVGAGKLPTSFGAESRVWKVELPGAGRSSPVVAHGKVFLQSSTPGERVFHCLDATSGQSKWTFSLPGKVGHTHTRNTLASGTAAVGKEGVYVTLWDGDRLHLFGFDLDGNKQWSRDLGTFVSQHGPGHSPIVEGGLVLFVNEQDEYAKLMAFDAKTGETAWEAAREKSRSCYSTPMVRDRADGTREVVVASTTGIGGYEVKSGRELWLWAWTANKLRTVASPIEAQGLVFVTGGDGGGSRNAAAVRLDGSGPLGEGAVAWSGGRGFPYVPSLLANGDHLYMVHDGGIAACHSVKTGEQVWTERIGGKFSASPILVGGQVLIVNEDGQIIVFPAEPAFKTVATGSLDETVFATPAWAGGRLYIRGDTHLHCFGPVKTTTALERNRPSVAGR
jgi:outer membrane protein assembly factor BamB